MPTDKQNVEFLYSIIKQLEVRHIDWPLVAEINTIPNGHAARMRFHRLRQAMDGTSPRPRVPKDLGVKKGKPTYQRKAKENSSATLKTKFAKFGEPEDDEEPLANLARKRIKMKEDTSDDEYVDESEVSRRQDFKSMKIKTEDIVEGKATEAREVLAGEEHHETLPTLVEDTDEGIGTEVRIKPESRD